MPDAGLSMDKVPTALWSKALWSPAEPWSEADIPPRPWIARGYLLRGSVTAIVGPGAAGKSSLLVAWTAALALGRHYSGFHPVRPCRVLIYSIEDDIQEQRRRFSAFLRFLGATPRDIGDLVLIVGPEQVGTLFGRKPDTRAIEPTAGMADMEQLIESFRPDVLILDPLVELHAEDENDNGALQSVLATIRALAKRRDLAAVVAHHTRKGSAGAAGDPDTSRGASAISGSCRVHLTVTNMTKDEASALGVNEAARRHLFRLDSAKANYAPAGEEEWFERVAHVLDNGDHVAAATPWSAPEQHVMPGERDAIAADIAKGSSLGPWSPKLSADARSVLRIFERHGITARPAQKRTLDELIAAGFQVRKFKRGNRDTGSGLSSPSGDPSNVHWLLS